MRYSKIFANLAFIETHSAYSKILLLKSLEFEMVNVNDCIAELAKHGIDGASAVNLRAIQLGCKRSQTLDEIVNKVRVSMGMSTLCSMLSIDDAYSVDEKQRIGTWLREGAHVEDVFALIRPNATPKSK